MCRKEGQPLIMCVSVVKIVQPYMILKVSQYAYTENRYNKAHASWTSTHETGATPDDEVVTYVYGLGILKDDANIGVTLAGAKFRLHSDVACTKPVYVIPTDIDGVYMVDSDVCDYLRQRCQRENRSVKALVFSKTLYFMRPYCLLPAALHTF